MAQTDTDKLKATIAGMRQDLAMLHSIPALNQREARMLLDEAALLLKGARADSKVGEVTAILHKARQQMQG